MSYPMFDQNDTSIVGGQPAAIVLRDPRVVMVTANPGGAKFNPTRPAQDWYMPDATEGLITLKFATDPKLHSIDFDNPRLVQAAIPLEWLKTPNIQDNPSQEGGALPLLPAPMRDLEKDSSGNLVEHLVALGAGTWDVPQLYVRKGNPPPPPAPPSTGSGTYDQDRSFILSSLTAIKQALGIVQS